VPPYPMGKRLKITCSSRFVPNEQGMSVSNALHIYALLWRL